MGIGKAQIQREATEGRRQSWLDCRLRTEGAHADVPAGNTAPRILGDTRRCPNGHREKGERDRRCRGCGKRQNRARRRDVSIDARSRSVEVYMHLETDIPY